LKGNDIVVIDITKCEELFSDIQFSFNDGDKSIFIFWIYTYFIKNNSFVTDKFGIDKLWKDKA